MTLFELIFKVRNQEKLGFDKIENKIKRKKKSNEKNHLKRFDLTLPTNAPRRTCCGIYRKQYRRHFVSNKKK